MPRNLKLRSVAQGLILVLMILLVVGTASPGAVAARPSSGQEIRIAGQFGLVYAPLMVAKEKKIFEKYGLEPVWKEFGSGAAVREALISGDVDVGFMGIPPFLIGWDKGLPWKVALGFNVVPVGLVTYDPDIKSLKDLKPTDKIAVPSPGSVQDIILAMAAERQLGNPKAFEKQLVAMPHPDAAAALISKKGIAAHFTTPPYLFEELEQPGFHEILNHRQAFGKDFSFNVGVVAQRFHDSRPSAYTAMVKSINESMAIINQNPREVAQLLAPEFGLPAEKLYKYLTWPGMNFTSTPYGLMEFAVFMQKAGFTKKIPHSLDEIVWENMLAVMGGEK
ncbi:MAG: ABC transporter substrate-binding protein [Syntrophothermus sp.]